MGDELHARPLRPGEFFAKWRRHDVARAVLGQDEMRWFGFSYGTQLGATYADLFPEKVDKMVLDGAVDVTLDAEGQGLGQATGFQQALEAYLASCVDEGDCPLGDSVDQVMAGMRDFLEVIDTNPIPSGDPRAPQLTEGWGVLGIAAASTIEKPVGTGSACGSGTVQYSA